MEQTVDSLLAVLAGMGFELERCQAAVNSGKLTVQDAVDWLLQGGDKETVPSRSTPSLSLRTQGTSQDTSSSGSSYLPFSIPPAPIPSEQAPTTSPSSPPQQTSSATSATSPSKTGISSPEDSSKVVSRFNLSDQKKEDKERYEREEREKAQVEARETRRREKQARNQILREIQADREARQMKSGSKATQQGAQSAPSKVGAPSDAESKKQEAAAESSASNQPQQKAAEQVKQPQAEAAAAAKAQTCLLQIRLPSGQSLREKFDASTTLQVVKDQVCLKQPNLPGIGFMQPFPHRLFTEADLSSTLAQLQLTPSGCLVVRTDTQGPPNKIQRSELDQSSPESQSSPPAESQSQGDPRPLAPRPVPGMFPGQPVVPGLNPLGRSNPAIAPMGFMRPPMPLGSPVGPGEPWPAPEQGHSWGRGQVLEGAEGEQVRGQEEEEQQQQQDPMEVPEDENVELEEAMGAIEEDPEMEGEDDDDEDEAGMYPNHPWGQPGRRGGDWPHPHFDFEGGLRRDWGSGRRLGGDLHNFEYGFGEQQQAEAEQAEDAVPDPQRAAAAALQRLATRPQPSTSSTPHHPDKPVTSLLDSCLKCVSKRFEGHTQHPLTAVEALPPQLALRLIDELKKAGVLRPKTLQLFLPCHLQQLSLDSYKYTTNELVQTLRYYTSLTRLSLSACPLITDLAIAYIIHLKKLQHINLSNNIKLTDNVCQSLTELPNLVTVVLEGTGVTDHGVEAIAVSSPQHLNNLNLSRTTVTDAVFPLLAGFPNLKNLGLEATKITTLENLEHLTGLKILNIARNSITQEGLQRVKRLTALIALNISQLEGISGDDALHCIQGMELKQLQLPDRHTTTDAGLRCIAGMPLTGLDMTDYINITNEGVHHLADMTSLRKLSLSNTKITDSAMTYIQGLSCLEELHLDRTAITDDGAKVLGAFSKLQVLSMAATQITNRFFCSGVLNACVRLTRLNLNRVTISDEGILSMKLPYLALLNLDSTCVTQDVARQLKTTCPSLKVVRTNNLRPTREAEEV